MRSKEEAFMRDDCNFSKRLELLMESDQFFPVISDDFTNRLVEKKKRRGYLTAPDIGKITGVSATAVKNWLYTGAIPKMSCLKSLSTVFGVSVEWLLGQTETTNLETKVGFEAFDEMGFTVTAYENLCALKRQGIDMKQIMSGVNHLLEYSTQPYAHKRDLIEEYREQAENEETNEEKQYLLDAAERISKETVEIHLPILEQLNRFFDLYSDGIYARIPMQQVVALQAQLENCKDNPDAWDQIPFFKYFRDKISPAQNDSTALFELENTLREIKKLLIVQKKEELAKIGPRFNGNYETDWAGVTYGYGASQEYALELMSEFYATDK